MAYIRKLPTGRYQAHIKRNGRIIKRRTFGTKRLARAWANEIESNHELIRAYQSGHAALKFTDLVDQWRSQYAGKDRTLPQRMKRWDKWLGDTLLMDIDSDTVKIRLEQYAAGTVRRHVGQGNVRATGKPRSVATVNRMRSALASVIKYATAHGIPHQDPVKGIPKLSEKNKRERFLGDQYHPRDEQLRLVRACKASSWDRLYLFVLMALGTGARASELLGLTWADINFDNGTAYLPDTKNGTSRNLVLVDDVLVELRLFRGLGKALVFPGKGRSGKPRVYHGPWQRALKQAGIEGLRFHDLRHTTASWFVMSGKTLFETAQMLGHKSVATTERYAHLKTEHLRNLASDVMRTRLAGK
jgi:integrase